jgi:hypothetical protein
MQEHKHDKQLVTVNVVRIKGKDLITAVAVVGGHKCCALFVLNWPCRL